MYRQLKQAACARDGHRQAYSGSILAFHGPAASGKTGRQLCGMTTEPWGSGRSPQFRLTTQAALHARPHDKALPLQALQRHPQTATFWYHRCPWAVKPCAPSGGDPSGEACGIRFPVPSSGGSLQRRFL